MALSPSETDLAQVDRLVQMVRADRSIELETRLGRQEGGRFVPGVSREHMDALLAGMVAHSALPNASLRAATDEWEETEDYGYTHQGLSLRTRVRFSSVKDRPETVRKTVLHSFVIKTHVYDIRVCASREEDQKDVPQIVVPEHVRIKQSRRFDSTSSPFSVFVSMVWQGPTYSDAERMQATAEPRFEVECELDAPRDAKEGRSTRSTSLSLLGKTSSLLLLAFLPPVMRQTSP